MVAGGPAKASGRCKNTASSNVFAPSRITIKLFRQQRAIKTPFIVDATRDAPVVNDPHSAECDSSDALEIAATTGGHETTPTTPSNAVLKHAVSTAQLTSADISSPSMGPTGIICVTMNTARKEIHDTQENLQFPPAQR